MAFKKSRWFNPYTTNKNGRLIPAIRDCWTCAQAGVYMIRHKQTETIVYVGSSRTQLKKTIYRHFQEWNDRQKKGNRRFERKTYPKTGHYEIRFIKCDADRAIQLEKYLINKLQPKDNPLKYEGLTQAGKDRGQRLLKKALAARTLKQEEYLEEAPF